ncbi:MAG TPA: universal stress protein, partial [Solirubrobacteraceae bacterium]|nr:universal stress protein [Solirubrobacteraceae bacterium]
SAVVETTVADAILSTAAELDADLVVVGTRGHTGVKSLLLGSVSQHVLQHADRPVMVIPGQELAQARASHRESLGG